MNGTHPVRKYNNYEISITIDRESVPQTLMHRKMCACSRGMLISRVQTPSCSALSWHYSRIWHRGPKTYQKCINCGLSLRNARREIHGRCLKPRLTTALQHWKLAAMGRQTITTRTASKQAVHERLPGVLRWRSSLLVYLHTFVNISFGNFKAFGFLLVLPVALDF